MKKSVIVISILVCVTCIVVLIISVILFIVLSREEEKPPEPIIMTPFIAAQLKCIDYAKVACDNPIPSDRKLPDKSSRIVLGREVSEGTFPHMLLCFGQGASGCGKADELHGQKSIRLKIGTADLLDSVKRHIPSFNEFFNNRTGTVYYTEKIIVHEEYQPDNETTWVYNIALLKLATKVEFDWRKRPICLNTNYSSIGRKNMTTSGWGFEGSFFTSRLRIADQYIDDEKIKLKCVSKFPSLINKTICAGNPDSSEGLCYGDRGSPLQIPSENKNATLCVNTHEQIGIAFNYTCWAPFDVPLLGLYTEVAQLVHWIAPQVWPEMFDILRSKNKTTDTDSKN